MDFSKNEGGEWLCAHGASSNMSQPSDTEELTMSDEEPPMPPGLPPMPPMPPMPPGEEVTDWVMDHDQSIVFDQAENRMWAQMSLMAYLINPGAWEAMREFMGLA
jgi:aspartate carbamoyltransferase catalytic subunit